MVKDKASLEQYLPRGTAEAVFEMLRTGKIALRIVRQRKTKLGDFRPATSTRPHRISVNNDLNPYEFLFTLLHELAHHQTFVRYGRHHKPHGAEWRAVFADIIKPFLMQKVFPPELEQDINAHFEKNGITHCSDAHLRESFGRYDSPKDPEEDLQWPTVDMLPLNSKFAVADGREFIKLALRRKRFTCFCYNNKRLYIFGPKVRVIPLDDSGKPLL